MIGLPYGLSTDQFKGSILTKMIIPKKLGLINNFFLNNPILFENVRAVVQKIPCIRL